MPVAGTDIKLFLSGGGSNADPNASLGGAISSTQIASNVAHNLFDDVSSDEAAAGDNEYRCFYVKNTHASADATGVKLFLPSNTPSSATNVQVGLDPAGVDGAAPATVTDENTAPSGVTFSNAPDSAGALAIGSLAHGSKIAVWLKRAVTAGAGSAASDPFTIRVTGTPV